MALLFWIFYVVLTIKTLAGVYYLVRCCTLFLRFDYDLLAVASWIFWFFSFFNTAFLCWMIWLFTYLQSVMCPPWPIWHDWPSVFSLITCWPHVTRRSASTNQSPSRRAGDQWEAGWWHVTSLAGTWHITFPLPVSSLRGMWRVSHGDTSSTSDNREAIRIQIRKQNTSTNLDLASITYILALSIFLQKEKWAQFPYFVVTHKTFNCCVWPSSGYDSIVLGSKC